MADKRWLRIIPVALIMYTISYVDRTNISLALDPKISSMMRDLAIDDTLKGEAAGIFFLGYVLLQIPGGYWAARWGARKVVSVFLIAWGLCAVGCGLAQSFRHFEIMRFLLGVAESGVFPATVVLLANWFPRSERARANAYWNLCQPLAVAGSAPITGYLLGAVGWKQMLMLEGALPFLWLPIWWFGIRDHPREAKWLSPEERSKIEQALATEAAEIEGSCGRAATAGARSASALSADVRFSPSPASEERAGERRHPSPTSATSWSRIFPYLANPALLVMLAIYFLHNCAAYGCMTFFTAGLKGRGFTQFQYGLLFAAPYVLTAIIMIINSWHSDKTHERRGHAAIVYLISGTSLLLSVSLHNYFWLSYILLCFAIPGPFAAMAPFWSIPTETMPRAAAGVTIGVVNAFGNLGGFAGPYIVGWLKHRYDSTAVSFNALGLGMVIAAGLCFLLPKAKAALEVTSLPERETVRS